MKKNKKVMNELIVWKLVLWGTPVFAALILLLANYKINQITEVERKENEALKTLTQSVATDTSKSLAGNSNGDTYIISSNNQSGGFTGVINNDVDDLQAMEIFRLLDEVEKDPAKYQIIYDRLDLLPIRVKYYSKFKPLIELSTRLTNETQQPDGSSQYADFRNRTMPFMLKHFPLQVYQDVSLDKEFELRSQLQFFSNDERVQLIKVLNNVTNANSFKNHKNAIKSMLIDLCGYSPELLPTFEKIFGEQKIKKMKPLWNEQELEKVYSGYRELLFKYNII